MKLIRIFILLVGTMLFACQDEVTEVREPAPDEAFTALSPEAVLIYRTTLKDGSSDNILDNSSCISVVFPVTVVVNGQSIEVITEEDFRYIERLLDESDDDELAFQFPITIILADHTEIVVESEEELDDLDEDCQEGGSDDDIECIDFVYPITLSIYNTASQVAAAVSITSDKDFNELIESIEEEEFVSIEFPIELETSAGAIVTVQNNPELEEAIDTASDDCDEDDDNDFDEDDVDDSALTEILTDGSWEIDYFFDESDQTTLFSDFEFTFLEDGTVEVTNGITEFTGTWATYGDDGELELELILSEDPFDELSEDWFVVSFSQETIELVDEADEEPEKELVFKKL